MEGVAPQELPFVSILLGSSLLQEQSLSFFLPTLDDQGQDPPGIDMPVLPTGRRTHFLSSPEGMLHTLLSRMRYGIIEHLSVSIALTDYYSRFYKTREGAELVMDKLKTLQIVVPFSMQRIVLEGIEMPSLIELQISGSLYPFDGPWWWEFCTRHSKLLARVRTLRLELPSYENRGHHEQHPLYAFPNVETLVVDQRESASMKWLLVDPTRFDTPLPRLTRLLVVSGSSYIPGRRTDWFDQELRVVMEEVARARDDLRGIQRLEVVKWCAPTIDDCVVVLRDNSSSNTDVVDSSRESKVPST